MTVMDLSTYAWCHNRQFPGAIDPSTGCVEARRLI
jgi:hypothetical protein